MALARATRGDRKAFATLVRTYGRPLAKLAGSYGVAPAETEDVVQDAFVAAWRSLPDYDPAKPFRPWLFQILLNKARDWRRQRRVRAAFFGASSLDDALDIASDQPAPDQQTNDRRAWASVKRALLDIPDNLKNPLLLVTVAGMARAEAAATLGISVKALDRRIDRARERLSAIAKQFKEE